MQAIRTIHSSERHFGWDNALPPVAKVEPGTTLEFEIVDSSGGQLDAASDASALTTLDFGRVNPTTGPIAVDGAEPGDALVVTIHGFEPLTTWGWTGIIPGFGLLAEDFTTPVLHTWTYDSVDRPAAFGAFARVPLQPFAGTIGVALAEPGLHSVVPPRRVGGNLDTRDLCAGTVLTLPVEVPDALFSIGDTHAAQGDGEVCGTALETSMRATVTLDLRKGEAPPTPQYETTAPTTRHVDGRGHVATTGVGTDLMVAARDAVRSMVDLLDRRFGIPVEQGYMLCSVASDVRITEIVDAPNWVVACLMPRLVLES